MGLVVVPICERLEAPVRVAFVFVHILMELDGNDLGPAFALSVCLKVLYSFHELFDWIYS